MRIRVADIRPGSINFRRLNTNNLSIYYSKLFAINNDDKT
jgi:hypothetical protein